MDQDLKNLIESPEFGQYHQTLQEPQKFNPFDVLRYADYEIRHSNVLAWLLTPSETQGIGDKFLRKFVQCLDLQRLGLKPDYSTSKVRVERERYDVDITIFLDEEELLIAVENKTVELYSEAIEQAMGYETQQLRPRYKNRYRIQSVLLTTTGSDGNPLERSELIHVSWFQVHEIITSLFNGGQFTSSSVGEFVRHYLDIVERLTDPLDTGHFKKLLDTHTPILRRLLEEGARGEDDLAGELGQEHSSTVARLVRDFEQKPADQRSRVRNYMERKGIKTRAGSHGTTYWLYWHRHEVARALNFEWCLVWAFEFWHGGVTLKFYFPSESKKGPKRTVRQEFIRFMQMNPIDRSQPPGESGKYSMEEHKDSNFYVYQNRLLNEDELSALPFQESMDLLCEKLDAFFAPGSDYEKIETYFQCLAFDPKRPTPDDAELDSDE